MKRSLFNLSNYKLLTMDMGYLTPVGVMEVLPGDTIQQATSALVRVSPLLAPVMHPVHIKIHHWYVPLRLIWPNFESFITGGLDGMDATVWPHFSYGAGFRSAVTEGSLADYLGLPPGLGTGNSDGFSVSALPFRAYAMIFNENYRDQDLVTPLVMSTADGLDTTTNATLTAVAWEKDYFTTTRPWTQKGPEVTLPFGQFAPVVPVAGPVDNQPRFSTANDLPANTPLQVNNGSANVVIDSAAGETSELFWNHTGLRADLSGATAVSINALREAFAIQRYEEARARYGARYTEYLRYLGIKSSDARLQRPEYLGGGKQTIQFSEVLQTAPYEESGDPPELTDVGTLRGHGISALRSNTYRRFFEEHGLVISLMSVVPKTIYAQGVSKLWGRQTKFDYFQRELQHIGQQPVYRTELYYDAAEEEPLGYQDRYDEYRRTESTIAGEFRTTLDFWHYARIFEEEPELNAEFITANPTKRVNAVQSENVLWVMVRHHTAARRQVAAGGGSFIA